MVYIKHHLGSSVGGFYFRATKIHENTWFILYTIVSVVMGNDAFLIATIRKRAFVFSQCSLSWIVPEWGIRPDGRDHSYCY